MANVDVEFLSDIFVRQPGKYICLSKKYKDRWQDKFFIDINSAIDWIKEQPHRADLYFCPTKFNKPRRRKDFVENSFFLWSDLDEADPTKIVYNLKPSHAWQSSPGRYQALWELPKACEPDEIEKRNKGLAYNLSADKSGWDLTQVLRIPGTRNNKYDIRPQVKVLWINHENIRPIESYPYVNGQTNFSNSEIKDLENPDRILHQYKNKLPKKLIRLLKTKEITVGKRSDVLWYLANTLTKLKLSKSEIFTLIKASAWNKYRGRSDENKRLSIEIEKVNDKSQTESTELKPRSEFKTTHLKVLSQDQFLSNTIEKPNWLVDKFWARESHGIVAGEPKSFKSTFLLDFVISVASGKPFLHHYKVNHTGPVLVIQNENSDWIMQDRIRKIMTSKGLNGNVFEYKEGKLTFRAPKSLPIYYVNQQGFLFSDGEHLNWTENFVSKHRPLVVVFDPLYLMFEGDVNSAKELNPVLNWLLELKHSQQISPILVHHWNKGGTSKRGGQRMLGSTVLHGWIESAWYLSVMGDNEDEGSENPENNPDLMNEKTEATLVLEREFRGSGLFPKLDMTVSMGEMGEGDYSLEIERHMGKRGRPKLDRETITGDIMGLLANCDQPLNISAISQALKLGRRIIKDVMDRLIQENKVIELTKGYAIKN